MPASKKDARKQKQKLNGGPLPHNQKKEETAAVCTVCRASFRVTKRNVELVQHASKHAGKKFDECFPGQTHE